MFGSCQRLVRLLLITCQILVGFLLDSCLKLIRFVLDTCQRFLETGDGDFYLSEQPGIWRSRIFCNFCHFLCWILISTSIKNQDPSNFSKFCCAFSNKIYIHTFLGRYKRYIKMCPFKTGKRNIKTLYMKGNFATKFNLQVASQHK